MDFNTQLKIGNEKENYVCDILNLCGLKTTTNNNVNVKDIDLKINDLDILLDVKFINTPFNNSKLFVGIEPQDCMPINVKHINTYYDKEIAEKKQSWVCFLVKFDLFNINELRFIAVSHLKYLIESGNGKIRKGKLNLDRNLCYDMTAFLKFCEKRKESITNPKNYKFI